MSDPEPAITPEGPCEAWATAEDITVTEICDVSTDQIEELLVAATDIVWVILGRPNIGICEATIYPCQAQHGWRRWQRGLEFWDGRSYGYGVMGDCGGCGTYGAIKLDTPVVDVLDVTVDSESLLPADFVLVDGQWLVRPGRSWPAGGSELDYADFSVTYQFGSAVPPLIRDATVEVAVDLWRSRPGFGNPFPAHADSVSRQGVSFSTNEAERVASRSMGMPSLGKAIAVYNPGGQPFPSYVWSPDGAGHNRTVRTFP